MGAPEGRDSVPESVMGQKQGTPLFSPLSAGCYRSSAGEGEVSSTLTGFYPYGRYRGSITDEC